MYIFVRSRVGVVYSITPKVVSLEAVRPNLHSLGAVLIRAGCSPHTVVQSSYALGAVLIRAGCSPHTVVQSSHCGAGLRRVAAASIYRNKREAELYQHELRLLRRTDRTRTGFRSCCKHYAEALRN